MAAYLSLEPIESTLLGESILVEPIVDSRAVITDVTLLELKEVAR